MYLSVLCVCVCECVKAQINCLLCMLPPQVWKARMLGYEEAAKKFRLLDEDSSEFAKFAPMMKKFVVESNAFAQEKAVDAALVFVENAPISQAARYDVDVCICAGTCMCRTNFRCMCTCTCK